MSSPQDFSCDEVIFCEAECIEGMRSVQVLIPSNEFKVKAARIPDEAYEPDPFENVTPVTNFKICTINNEEETSWIDDDNPFELRVEYSNRDWHRYKNNRYKRPWLAQWENGEWNVFDNVAIDPVDGSFESGGILIVKISKWVDPPIGIV